MSTLKLSPEYRVRWRRRGWPVDEHAHVTVVGSEETARAACAFIAAQYDDVVEVVLEVRQVTRFRHHAIYVLDETPARTPTRTLEEPCQ